MTKIILARTYFESGEYVKALEAIQEAGLREQKVSDGYSFSVYIQALSMKGTHELKKKKKKVHRLTAYLLAMSLDLSEKLEEAMDTYQHLVAVINQCPNLIDRPSVDWSEEALYRGTLLALSEK